MLSFCLTFFIHYDIILSRYNDIICEVFLLSFDKTNKSMRTRQVQFRMDPNKLKKLRTAIINDDKLHSMADLFNKAADEYLKKKENSKNIK